jgi:hypothetical protein
MATTPPGPLARANYLTWPPGVYVASADPNNPAFDPSAVQPLSGIVAYGDAALDTEQYHRPLERLHGSGLHGPGVATGLEVSCLVGQPNLVIAPGVALDPQGRHIYLANGGSAEIGPSADVPGTPPTLTQVTPTGAVLPTGPLSLAAGTYYIVVQWRETWESGAYVNDPNVHKYNDTPWLRLVTVAGYQPDLQVILGEVAFEISNEVAVVQSAGYGGPGGLQRSAVSLPAQALNLKRAVTTSAPGAATASWGAVRAREAGGVEIAVAKSGDQVALVNDSGGNFSTLAVGANQATIGNAANPGINLNGAEATIFVGAPGNYGDVLVSDGNGHQAVSLVGDTGHIVVGGPTLNGQVRVKNSAAQDTMTLNGANGAAVVQRVSAFANNTIDMDGIVRVHGTDLNLDGRSHNNNRALVDGDELLIVNYAGDYHNGVLIESAVDVLGNLNVAGALSTGGQVTGDPLWKVSSWTLYAASDFSGGPPSIATATIDLGQSMEFTAFVFFSYVQNFVSVTYNAAAVAEIYLLDGVPPQSIGSGGPLGTTFPRFLRSKGRNIGFRVRAADDSIDVSATIVVFHQ